MTTNYLVTWHINIDAENPEQAAKRARTIQLDRMSLATHFWVCPECPECKQHHSRMAVEVDLMEGEIH